MNHKIILFFILGIDALVLFLKIPDLSISYYEASLLYGDASFLQYIIKLSLYFFGQNDFALRLPMIFFHLISALLLFKISKKYIKDDKNRLWLILVFVLLPGVISSAIIVNSAGLLIFGLLFFVYLYNKDSKIAMYLTLVLYAFIDSGFNYLFLSLIIFSLYKKQRKFLLLNILLLSVSIYIFGLNVFGLPKGHFLDSIGIYSAIFTPIIFIYIFYVLYRRYLTKEIEILWFISSTALILSLLLSFRQRISLEEFAPYLIIALPLAAQTFIGSYRVRLKIFRTKYRAIFVISFVFLLLNSFLVFFNKNIYLLLDNPKKHFAYKMHVAKELANELKSRGVTCVKSKHSMSKRLKFYNIDKCEYNILIENKVGSNKISNVTISYKNRPVYSAYVTKLYSE